MADWKKNDTVELEITDMSDEGAGIGKADGFTFFVKDAVVGDRILAGVTKVKKNYGFARLAELLSPSKDRVTPRCPIARQCGGCQLQALSYEAQLAFKQRKVLGNLTRIGGFDLDALREEGCKIEEIAAAPHPYRYRNKAQFPIGRDRNGVLIAGFYAGRTHSIIPCGDCLLGCRENQAILDCILTWMEKYGISNYDEQSGKGLMRHVLIRRGYYTGEMMVCLVINGKKLPHAEKLVKALLALELSEAGRGAGEEGRDAGAETETKWPVPARITSISCNINEAQTNVILGTELLSLYGPLYIEDEIHAAFDDEAARLRFQISPLSFYQVNPLQMERLYRTALDYADLCGRETVWDLYCGIGTISLFLAQRAKKVYGLEIVPQAVDNARDNAVRNNLPNTEFFVGKAEEVLPAWYQAHGEEQIDVIVTDPPRKGCDEACLQTMVEIAPKRIVYVSCDSATLARDLKYLCAHGYRLEKVRAFDQFAGTVHCEVVVLMSKVKE